MVKRLKKPLARLDEIAMTAAPHLSRQSNAKYSVAGYLSDIIFQNDLQPNCMHVTTPAIAIHFDGLLELNFGFNDVQSLNK